MGAYTVSGEVKNTVQEKVERLINQLTEGSVQERADALTALITLGEPAVEPLLATLNDTHYQRSWHWVATILGKIGDRRAVQQLIELLENSLASSSFLTARSAIEALADLKDMRAVDTLLEALEARLIDEEDNYDEPEGETIELAIGALTEIGDTRAIEPIMERLLRGDYWQDGSSLKQWGEPMSDLFIAALHSNDATRRAQAATLVGEFGDRRAVQPLIRLLSDDKSDTVRHHAAYALGNLGDIAAYDALLAALNDSYEQTRAYAAQALGKLKDKRAIPALKQAWRDPHPLVQKMAEWAVDWMNC